MTRDRVTALVARLDIGLQSPGVCCACLSFVAFALDDCDERKVAGQITQIAPVLWDEGLGDAVRGALETAATGDAGAQEALRALEAGHERSAVFRAVVRRLAVEAREEVRRAHLASLN